MEAPWRREYRKPDGRRLWLYGQAPHEAVGEPPRAVRSAPQLRWHPLRGEWVTYAPHRQERTFLPTPPDCPLCPSRPDGPGTEVPFRDFDVAVFENRFPALVESPPPARSDLPVPTAPGQGACEVVVYTPEHTGSLATLSQRRRELLVQVWSDRYRELYRRPHVQFVLPFENRGEEVGVTLHHPHGQVYAYPFVPPVAAAELEAFARSPVLAELLSRLPAEFVVAADEHAVAFVPPFARYPYEVWVAPRRTQPGPWTMSEAERRSVAWLLGEVVRRYDGLCGRPFPYVMVLHAAPRPDLERPEGPRFHFHVEFYPPLRSADRLKFLAGTELGAGVFVVDVLPEEAARALQGVGPAGLLEAP